MGNFDDDEIYPNQPLTDVACEVRFAGEMQVECERHLFWNQVRDVYPKVFVPYARDGRAPALQHYRFRSEDEVRTVSVALNSLSFSENRYSGHGSFISEFERLLGIFRKTYPLLGVVKRVGWRYINVIPYSREEGKVPLGRFLKLDIPLPSKFFDCTTALDLSWTGTCMDGELIIRVNSVSQKEASQQEGILLDIDFGQTREDIRWQEVPEAIRDGRAKCRRVFEELITDGYRDYLRGKTV